MEDIFEVTQKVEAIDHDVVDRQVVIKQKLKEVPRDFPEIERLTWLMDQSVRLPGGFRIGLDGIIGLVPGVGDVATMLISGYIINLARKLGVSRWVIIKMVANVAFETILGAVPIVGDLFDFYYKANVRNLNLLTKYLDKH